MCILIPLACTVAVFVLSFQEMLSAPKSSHIARSGTYVVAFIILGVSLVLSSLPFTNTSTLDALAARTAENDERTNKQHKTEINFFNFVHLFEINLKTYCFTVFILT
jgi:hypothetical protein